MQSDYSQPHPEPLPRPRKLPPKGPHPKQKSAHLQAVEIQLLLLQDMRDTKTTAASRAQLARAWSDIENRKRELRNRPLPKPVDVVEQKRRRAPPAAPTISLGPEPELSVVKG